MEAYAEKAMIKKTRANIWAEYLCSQFILSQNIFLPQERKLEGKGKKNLMYMAQSQKTKMGKIKLTSILVRFPFRKTPGSETLNAFNHICPIKQELISELISFFLVVIPKLYENYCWPKRDSLGMKASPIDYFL